MGRNKAPSFLSHVKIIDVKSPFSYHIQLWNFLKKFSLSKFIIYFYFQSCGILKLFFHSWYLLRIGLNTIFYNFKHYTVICNLMLTCEKMS